MKAKILSLLLGALGPLLLHIIQTFVQKDILERAVGLARLEVERLMGDTSIDNQQKRDTARAFVRSQLKTVGMEITESVLNMAVEMAVVAVKSKYSDT